MLSSSMPSPSTPLQVCSRPLASPRLLLKLNPPPPSSLSGEPPKLTRDVADHVKPIQSASMNVVSATTLFVGAVKTVMVNPNDGQAPSLVAKFVLSLPRPLPLFPPSLPQPPFNLALDVPARYIGTLDDSLAQLVTAVKNAKKAGFVLEAHSDADAKKKKKP